MSFRAIVFVPWMYSELTTRGLTYIGQPRVVSVALRISEQLTVCGQTVTLEWDPFLSFYRSSQRVVSAPVPRRAFCIANVSHATVASCCAASDSFVWLKEWAVRDR